MGSKIDLDLDGRFRTCLIVLACTIQQCFRIPLGLQEVRCQCGIYVKLGCADLE
jgi:hypothetical protein